MTILKKFYLQYFDSLNIDNVDVEGMLGEMRRLSWEDPAYALNVIIAGITIALIHGNKLKNAVDDHKGGNEGVTAKDTGSVSSDVIEDRLEFLERLNRGTAVEFLEMSDMRRAYEAYKRSKGLSCRQAWK